VGNTAASDLPDGRATETLIVRSVLIIDDEAPLRANLRRICLLEGYSVTEAHDGAAALEHLRSSHPDLVLCDLMMPGLDGYALIEALRADPRTATIPVVILTASPAAEVAANWRARTAAACLTKPFKVEELLAAIGRVFAGETTIP